MDAWVDLHIHSCLSPCAENEMTPWNIVGMAHLKGLDAVAVTDHNAALNLPDAMTAGEALDVIVVPGLEVTTKEEIHVLTYFETLEDALTFGKVIYDHLPDVQNDPKLFGDQIITRDGDEEAGRLDKLLIAATDLSVDEVETLALSHHGVLIPAHINRGSYGMLNGLGLVPPLPAYPVVEASAAAPCPEMVLAGRRVLRSSDAHRLEDIKERDFTLPVSEKSLRAVFKALCWQPDHRDFVQNR